MSELHQVTVIPEPRHRPDPECPYVFSAQCSCGFFYSPNAPKWTLLAIQGHWTDAGLTGSKGLITDQLTGAIR